MSVSYRQHGWVRLTLMCIALGGVLAEAQEESLVTAPPSIQAVLIVKLLVLNLDVAQGGDITIYVLAAPEVTKALQAGVGRSIGKSVLKDIIAWQALSTDPPRKPAVLYIGDIEDVAPALAYCRQHKILSVTGVPKVGERGVSLTLGVMEKKAKIFLLKKGVAEEGVTLDPKIFALTTER